MTKENIRNAVIEEQLSRTPSPAPQHLVSPGQRWISNARKCYKCHHFKSNRHMSGHCPLKKRHLGMTGDFAKGDKACDDSYAPKWTEEHGLTDPPQDIKDL